MVYTENSIEIYDVLSGQWIQSVACRRATPLNQKATLSLYSGDSDNVKRLIFLSNPLIDSDQEMIKKLWFSKDVGLSKIHLSEFNLPYHGNR